MGSYISIVNNTKVSWQCRLSHDELSLKIAGIIAGVIGAIAVVIGTAGAAAPVFTTLAANGVVAVMGVSTVALAAITAGTAAVAKAIEVVDGVSGFGIAVADGLSNALDKDGFHKIEPGTEFTWGKKSLSLWQQGTCVRAVIVDTSSVSTETLYLHPIFTGPTAGSNWKHDIQYWLNRRGTEKQDIVAARATKRMLAASADDNQEKDIVYFTA